MSRGSIIATFEFQWAHILVIEPKTLNVVKKDHTCLNNVICLRPISRLFNAGKARERICHKCFDSRHEKIQAARDLRKREKEKSTNGDNQPFVSSNLDCTCFIIVAGDESM